MSKMNPVPSVVLPTSDLSPRNPESTVIQNGLLTPIRDGVKLSMDLIRPRADGAEKETRGSCPIGGGRRPLPSRGNTRRNTGTD